MNSDSGSMAQRGAARYGARPYGARLPAERTGLWASLESLYLEYCRAQARELLGLIPREGIRPLYRRALEWAGEAEAGRDPDGEDREPLDLMEAYCLSELIPLPPFRVWARDYLANRKLYLTELDRAPRPARDGEPVDVDLRELEWGGRRWTATLRLRRGDGDWRGAVAFRSGEDAGATTGEVFRETTPFAVRDRFRRLEQTTLQAFLRSALPCSEPHLSGAWEPPEQDSEL